MIDNKRVPAILKQGEKIVFNFDIKKTIRFLLFEEYCKKKIPIQSRLPFHYHKIPFRIAIAKFLTSVKQMKKTKRFPSWPIEKSVELLRAIFLNSLQMTGKDVKQKSFWPDGRKFAIALTHDIDTKKGFRFVKAFTEIEESYGFKSTWNVVARNFHSNKKILDNLFEKGNEIGCHGYVHDNKIAYLTKEGIRKRFRKSMPFLKQYNVKLFRSPSLLTSKNLDKIIPEFFSYDSSVSDTEIVLPDAPARGCCTIFPFIKDKIVEIPLTAPMDSTLVFLRYNSEKIYKIWTEKIRFIKRLNGMFVINTHPEPHFSANKKMLKVYEGLLNHLSEQPNAWKSTTSEIGEWWKKRTHYKIEI